MVSATKVHQWSPLGIALALLAVAGCRSNDTHVATRSVGVPDSQLSAPPELPNDEQAAPSKSPATAHENDSYRKSGSLDGGLALLQPTPLREDRHLAPDTPIARDSNGITLEAEWKASDWPSLANVPEVERERFADIRNKTRWTMRIDLIGSGRMRIALASWGFAFEKGTEFRSRVDLLGHIIVWPAENQYRILPAGSLRSLFQEGRVDVGSTLVTNLKPAGPGRWLEWETERVAISNAFGRLVFDQAAIPAAGVSGRLLCRWLVEFISADPASSICQNDLVPVHGQFDFSGGGKAEFVTTQLSKKQEYPTLSIAVPPPGATPNSRELPRASSLSNAMLLEHRNRLTPKVPIAPAGKLTGLVAANHTLGLRTLLVDGLTAAWFMPGEERSIPELTPGTYTIAWRDFLGIASEAPKNITLPARVSVGAF